MRIKALDASCLPLCTFAECPFVCCPPPLIFAVYLDHLIHMFYASAPWHVFPEEKYVWHGLSLSLVDRPLKFPHEQRGIEKKAVFHHPPREKKPAADVSPFSLPENLLHCQNSVLWHSAQKMADVATFLGILRHSRATSCPTLAPPKSYVTGKHQSDQPNIQPNGFSVFSNINIIKEYALL